MREKGSPPSPHVKGSAGQVDSGWGNCFYSHVKNPEPALLMPQVLTMFDQMKMEAGFSGLIASMPGYECSFISVEVCYITT